MPFPGRVLFLENDDSFSWNVVESLPLPRQRVLLRPGREVAARPALLDEAELVVIGPGPGEPQRSGLAALVLEAARRSKPLLGICLGHQALGLAYGARLVQVPPVHGRQSRVDFEESRLFPGMQGPQLVMRYHSLALAEVPEPLRVIARSEDGLPMAIAHRSLPMAGLQFHPDSFGSPRGRDLLAAFFEALG